MLRVLATAFGSVSHDEQLSTVGHLDELRTRLLVCLAVLAVAFGFCFAQNHRLLGLINRPLATQTQAQVRDGRGPLGATYTVSQSARNVAVQLQSVVGVLRSHDAGTSRAVRSALAPVSRGLKRDVASLSAPPQGNKPITLGIGEPFTTTATLSLVFALILTLPLLLHQAFAFLAPALGAQERKRIRPLMFSIPGLFVAGVMFGYFVVLPAAVHFFVNFDSSQFNVLVQAGPYYKFAATIILAMGVVFEVPVAIVAATRIGLVSTERLRRSRRYAVAACGLVAAFLPGDAITLLLETVPLYLLFELGLLISGILDRRARTRSAL